MLALGVVNAGLLLRVFQLYVSMLDGYKTFMVASNTYGSYVNKISNYIFKLALLEVLPHFSTYNYIATYA
jgi:hypothetical protein